MHLVVVNFLGHPNSVTYPNLGSTKTQTLFKYKSNIISEDITGYKSGSDVIKNHNRTISSVDINRIRNLRSHQKTSEGVGRRRKS